MWNSQKSLILSLICTKIAMAMTLVAAVLLPVYLKYSLLMSYGPYKHISDIIPFMIMIYICTVLGLTALIFLHRLLSNISENLIFTDANVRYIRTISWCCFGVAALAAGCTYLGWSRTCSAKRYASSRKTTSRYREVTEDEHISES